MASRRGQLSMESARKLAVILLIRRRRHMLLAAHHHMNSRYNRRWWVRELWMNRETDGEFYSTIQVLREKDPQYHKKYCRMSKETFDELLDLIHEHHEPHVVRRGRKSFPLAMGLYLTLRYLASTEQIQDIALPYKIGITTAANYIHATCELIWDVLKPLVMAPPGTDQWKTVAEDFEKIWQFPHCIGAVDGKHCDMQATDNSGTLFFNYKKRFSMVLMAVADAKYKFVTVDVGGYGRQSDGGTFKASPLGKDLESGKLSLPAPSCLANSTVPLPYVLVGDEAFQLKQNFMRPFPGKKLNQGEAVFNYRLSRARRCVENAFGILTSQWRIFRRQINLSPEHTENIIKAACVLHNFLRLKNEEAYSPKGIGDTELPDGTLISGQWRDKLARHPAVAFCDMPSATGHNYSRDAAGVREQFKEYFSSEQGAVSWQWQLPGIKK